MIAQPNQIKTDRDAFLWSRDHLLKQKKTSFSADGEYCAYRGESSRACAVGCLIPDIFYDDSIEGKAADNSKVVNMLKKAYPEWNFTDNSIDMLLAVQVIHDSHEPEDWERLLADYDHEFDGQNFKPVYIMEEEEQL